MLYTEDNLYEFISSKVDLKSFTLKEIQDIIVYFCYEEFRGTQIFNWIHKKNVNNFNEMTNIPKDMREELKNYFKLANLNIVKKIVSKIDGTTKYLFQIEDDNIIIESVLMHHSYGNSVCISTQAGCRMGCSFCASTIDGLERNLTTGEMLSQIYEIQKDIGKRISNVVMMGSGEPLDNFDNCIKFLNIINSEQGYNLGQRHITLSTCGIVDKIYKLAEQMLQITLAISLHAPNNEIRKRLMPIANRYDIDSVIDAAKFYAEKTKRRVTFEYALIKDINDSESCSRQLAKKLRGSLFHINLIPINDVKERNYIRTSESDIKNFASILESYNIEVTIRKEMGSDVNAACGQLRKGYRNNNRGV